MNNSTINRTNGKMGADLMKDIFKLLSSSERPLSTQDIAKNLGKPWHSVQTRCLMLQVESKVICFRIGRMNLWQISPQK